MILLIDNYDSFSYNLYQMVGSIDPGIKVIRNDEMSIKQIEELAYGSEFEQRQINKVWKYGIAFCGKKVCLRTADV